MTLPTLPQYKSAGGYASDAQGVVLLDGSYKASATITRPANITPYAAGSVIGTATNSSSAFELANIAPAEGGNVFITDTHLFVHVAAIPSGMTSFRLHLFDVTPPSALVDGAAYDLTAADRASYQGYVDLGAPQDFGSTLFAHVGGHSHRATALTSSLYGYIQTIGGYTPTSASVNNIRAFSVRA